MPTEVLLLTSTETRRQEHRLPLISLHFKGMTPRSLTKTFFGCKDGKRLLKKIYISKGQPKNVEFQFFFNTFSKEREVGAYNPA